MMRRWDDCTCEDYPCCGHFDDPQYEPDAHLDDQEYEVDYDQEYEVDY